MIAMHCIASGFIKALVWCNSIETWDVQMVTLQTFTLYAIQQGLVSLQQMCKVCAQEGNICIQVQKSMIHCVRQIFISRCTSRHSGPEYQYRITKHYSAACKIIKYMVEIKGRHHLYNESQARSCSHPRTYTVANAKSVDIYMNTSTQIVLPAPVLLGLPIDRSPIQSGVYENWR